MSDRTRYLGRVGQGVDERIAYQIDTVNIGTPTSPSAVAKAKTGPDTFSDVTTIVFPTNSPTVATTVITLSLFRNHTQGILYRIEVQYTIGGNLFEDIIEVLGEL